MQDSRQAPAIRWYHERAKRVADDYRPVSVAELRQLAAEHGACVDHVGESADALGRPEVSWAEVAIRLPEEGTEAR